MTRPLPIASDERGSASIELAVLALVFILLLMLAAYAWRSVQAVANVGDAAAEAARAVSLRDDDQTEAEAVARTSLLEAGTSCQTLSLDMSQGSTTTAVTTAETVSVHLECTVALADLAPLGVPGSQTLSASHTEIVDVYRGGRP